MMRLFFPSGLRGLTLAALFVLPACHGRNAGSGEALPDYLNERLSTEHRVEDALSRMSLEEKIAMVHAQSKFSSPGVPRLGIPDIWCSDGPHGVRSEVLWDEWRQAGWTNDSITAFPALTALAATWDPELSRLYGRNLGEEARFRGKSVLLGPGVNICRTPLNGRNFEYMGEDPCLASEMVVPYVEGVQSVGVAACVKHFALNNQERFRHHANVRIDRRTLHELYLPAFKAALLRGGAWSVMAAYNLYQDQHLCNNAYLLDTVLRQQWGYDGVVISDWGGVHNTDQTVRHGVDLEYGSWTNGLSSGRKNAYDDYYLATPYLEGIRRGIYGTEELDERVRRILRLEMRTNLDRNRPFGAINTPEHLDAARKIGAESIVLLKNEDALLPLSDRGRILVVGENAVKMMTVGGGSSSLKARREISPLEGIRERFCKAEILYERGYVGDVGGEQDGIRAGQDLRDKRSAGELLEAAVNAARTADCVIFIGGLNKSAGQDCEDSDRASLGLPYGQDGLIEALAAANPRLVVVNISGNPVAMPWIDRVPAVLQDWYLGSQAGPALADVLSGDVNPSGKLPFTFPLALEDGPLQGEEQYPGILRKEKIDGMSVYDEVYSEGLYVGYRWYETCQKSVLFPFGHGLSYTSFAYGRLQADRTAYKGDGRIRLRIAVSNIGSRPGAETVQIYLSYPKSDTAHPAKSLKAFKKVFLAPGETRTVEMTLGRDDLACYDEPSGSWTVEAGEYEVMAGASVSDIRSATRFRYRP